MANDTFHDDFYDAFDRARIVGNLPLKGSGEAAAKLRQKLDAAALEALQEGFDWCECLTPEPPVFSFAPDPSAYPALEIVIKAGNIHPGTPCPSGYQVIRHADWVAAGRPGLTDRPPIDT